MPVKKDGRRSLSEVSGAPSPSQSAKKDLGFCDCSTRSAKRNAAVSRRTPVRFPIRTSDAAKRCPQCDEPAFAGRGKHTVNARELAPGFTLGTQVYDEKLRGPKLIDPGTTCAPDYWVCQSCGHDWEEAHR